MSEIVEDHNNKLHRGAFRSSKGSVLAFDMFGLPDSCKMDACTRPSPVVVGPLASGHSSVA